MARISVGNDRGGRRSVDHELPLVPFIDFMVCLIAFLMVTAAWTQMSRINASGLASGVFEPPTEPAKTLHVKASSTGFELIWKRGDTVLDTEHVARVPVMVGGEQRFPALAQAITKEWETAGEYRAASDRTLDRAVLHVQNDLPFSDIVAVLDALHAPRRGKLSAFDVALAEN
jgi:biopolymer transport protein ExbD